MPLDIEVHSVVKHVKSMLDQGYNCISVIVKHITILGEQNYGKANTELYLIKP